MRVELQPWHAEGPGAWTVYASVVVPSKSALALELRAWATLTIAAEMGGRGAYEAVLDLHVDDLDGRLVERRQVATMTSAQAITAARAVRRDRDGLIARLTAMAEQLVSDRPEAALGFAS